MNNVMKNLKGLPFGGASAVVDPDLDSEIDNIEDMPEDIRNDLYGDEIGEKMYNAYKERFGKFKYGRKKEN